MARIRVLYYRKRSSGGRIGIMLFRYGFGSFGWKCIVWWFGVKGMIG